MLKRPKESQLGDPQHRPDVHSPYPAGPSRLSTPAPEAEVKRPIVVFQLADGSRVCQHPLPPRKRFHSYLPEVINQLGVDVDAQQVRLAHVRQGGKEVDMWDDYDFSAFRKRALASPAQNQHVKVYLPGSSAQPYSTALASPASYVGSPVPQTPSPFNQGKVMYETPVGQQKQKRPKKDKKGKGKEESTVSTQPEMTAPRSAVDPVLTAGAQPVPEPNTPAVATDTATPGSQLKGKKRKRNKEDASVPSTPAATPSAADPPRSKSTSPKKKKSKAKHTIPAGPTGSLIQTGQDPIGPSTPAVPISAASGFINKYKPARPSPLARLADLAPSESGEEEIQTPKKKKAPKKVKKVKGAVQSASASSSGDASQLSPVNVDASANSGQAVRAQTSVKNRSTAVPAAHHSTDLPASATLGQPSTESEQIPLSTPYILYEKPHSPPRSVHTLRNSSSIDRVSKPTERKAVPVIESDPVDRAGAEVDFEEEEIAAAPASKKAKKARVSMANSEVAPADPPEPTDASVSANSPLEAQQPAVVPVDKEAKKAQASAAGVDSEVAVQPLQSGVVPSVLSPSVEQPVVPTALKKTKKARLSEPSAESVTPSLPTQVDVPAPSLMIDDEDVPITSTKQSKKARSSQVVAEEAAPTLSSAADNLTVTAPDAIAGDAVAVSEKKARKGRVSAVHPEPLLAQQEEIEDAPSGQTSSQPRHAENAIGVEASAGPTVESLEAPVVEAAFAGEAPPEESLPVTISRKDRRLSEADGREEIHSAPPDQPAETAGAVHSVPVVSEVARPASSGLPAADPEASPSLPAGTPTSALSTNAVIQKWIHKKIDVYNRVNKAEKTFEDFVPTGVARDEPPAADTVGQPGGLEAVLTPLGDKLSLSAQEAKQPAVADVLPSKVATPEVPAPIPPVAPRTAVPALRDDLRRSSTPPDSAEPSLASSSSSEPDRVTVSVQTNPVHAPSPPALRRKHSIPPIHLKALSRKAGSISGLSVSDAVIETGSSASESDSDDGSDEDSGSDSASRSESDDESVADVGDDVSMPSRSSSARSRSASIGSTQSSIDEDLPARPDLSKMTSVPSLEDFLKAPLSQEQKRSVRLSAAHMQPIDLDEAEDVSDIESDPEPQPLLARTGRRGSESSVGEFGETDEPARDDAEVEEDEDEVMPFSQPPSVVATQVQRGPETEVAVEGESASSDLSRRSFTDLANLGSPSPVIADLPGSVALQEAIDEDEAPGRLGAASQDLRQDHEGQKQAKKGHVISQGLISPPSSTSASQEAPVSTPMPGTQLVDGDLPGQNAAPDAEATPKPLRRRVGQPKEDELLPSSQASLAPPVSPPRRRLRSASRELTAEPMSPRVSMRRVSASQPNPPVSAMPTGRRLRSQSPASLPVRRSTRRTTPTPLASSQLDEVPEVPSSPVQPLRRSARRGTTPLRSSQVDELDSSPPPPPKNSIVEPIPEEDAESLAESDSEDHAGALQEPDKTPLVPETQLEPEVESEQDSGGASATTPSTQSIGSSQPTRGTGRQAPTPLFLSQGSQVPQTQAYNLYPAIGSSSEIGAGETPRGRVTRGQVASSPLSARKANGHAVATRSKKETSPIVEETEDKSVSESEPGSSSDSDDDGPSLSIPLPRNLRGTSLMGGVNGTTKLYPPLPRPSPASQPATSIPTLSSLNMEMLRNRDRGRHSFGGAMATSKAKGLSASQPEPRKARASLPARHARPSFNLVNRPNAGKAVSGASSSSESGSESSDEEDTPAALKGRTARGKVQRRTSSQPVKVGW
ncbi:hypothetical protein IAU60_002988 [Kwoniella sp. DSM 27419]